MGHVIRHPRLLTPANSMRFWTLSIRFYRSDEVFSVKIDVAVVETMGGGSDGLVKLCIIPLNYGTGSP